MCMHTCALELVCLYVCVPVPANVETRSHCPTYILGPCLSLNPMLVHRLELLTSKLYPPVLVLDVRPPHLDFCTGDGDLNSEPLSPSTNEPPYPCDIFFYHTLKTTAPSRIPHELFCVASLMFP